MGSTTTCTWHGLMGFGGNKFPKTYHDQNREFAHVRNISEREANLAKLNLNMFWSVDGVCQQNIWTRAFKLVISHKIVLESIRCYYRDKLTNSSTDRWKRNVYIEMFHHTTTTFPFPWTGTISAQPSIPYVRSTLHIRILTWIIYKKNIWYQTHQPRQSHRYG